MMNTITEKRSVCKPWLMLLGRSLLFLLFQITAALLLFLAGNRDPWDASAAWWPLVVSLTNFVCLALLIKCYEDEGQPYWKIFRVERKHIKPDLLVMFIIILLVGPVAFIPNLLSAQWLFGNPQVALDLLVRPLPAVAAIVIFVLFPVTQGLVEIPVYMLYIMPRLEEQGLPGWMALSLASFGLAAQHIFIPFLPDGRFIAYRLVMFLPFAFFMGLVMRWRPRLMPYVAILHALLDFSVAAMFLPK